MGIKVFGDRPSPSHPHKHRPSVYAILPYRGRLLTTFQAGIHNELQLPGGGVDPGESLITALHREVYEETGWRIQSPKVYYRFRHFAFMPEYNLYAEKICTVFVAFPTLRISDPLEDEHTALFLTPKNTLNQLQSDGNRFALQRYMDQFS